MVENSIARINTISGQVIDLLNPHHLTIDIYDIARGLANKGHFGGHSPQFFSIAQHSLLVESLMDYDAAPELKMAALLHDATEAYLPDMPGPLKVLIPMFKECENKLAIEIFRKFDLDIEWLDSIKYLDIIAQKIEYDEFYNGVKKLTYLSPIEAFNAFLKRYFELVMQIRSFE